MLQGQAKFLEALGSCAIASLENQRLTIALDSSMEEVADSRARISAAADEERRRIERDLHDGAQQQLVTLRIKLAMIAEMIESDPEKATEQLEGAGDRLTDVLEGSALLRTASTHPCSSMQASARRWSRRAGGARFRPALSGRHRSLFARHRERRLLLLPRGAPECRQARRGAASISIQLLEFDGQLRFEVRDDGRASPRAPPSTVAGSPICRIASPLLGRLTVTSRPGGGTRILGNVPLTPLG